MEKKQEIKFDERNYRKHSKKNKALIKKSLEELGAGRSVVIDADDTLVAGNGVYEQAQELQMPVRVIETDGSELVVVKRTDIHTQDEKRRKLALADNAASDLSEWDVPLIETDWAKDVLADWGVELPEITIESLAQDKEEKEKNEEAERLLNKAMKQYCGEFYEQLQKAQECGFFVTGLSRGLAKLNFLQAKYYGRKYDKKNSFIFAPEIFQTSSHKKGCSYFEQLRRSATNSNDAGIAGFRTVTNDGSLLLLLGGSGYPIGGGRSATDFPVAVARDLLTRFAAGENARILDPCHGWGGRLTGALLNGVAEYVGVDPSQVANRALNDIYNTFVEYQDTKARFIMKPYEETTDEEVGIGFDFALTSPPYFDVEDYQGGEQSHKRYSNYKLWVDRFYQPLIEITMRRLKDGGVFALQVGSQTYPLKDDALKICRSLGYRAEVETKTLNADALHATSEDTAECTILIYK